MSAETTLGARIRRLREARKVTQAQCALALNIPRTAYLQVEQGGRRLTLLEGEILAQCFGVALRDLLPRRKPLEKADKV